MTQYGFIVALYLATQFVPIDKQGEFVFFSSETKKNMVLLLKYDKKQDVWQIREKDEPEKGGDMKIDTKEHSVLLIPSSDERIDISKFIVLEKGKKINFKKLKLLKPTAEYLSGENKHENIVFEIQKNKLTFSQKQGFLSDLKVITVQY
ncbi:MAG: hypothetical protein EAZ44_05090 [Cytophagia bacterium]|nr:MAG: hypothetical protein EAZ44_05090 [Cytophagia bacterium]